MRSSCAKYRSVRRRSWSAHDSIVSEEPGYGEVLRIALCRDADEPLFPQLARDWPGKSSEDAEHPAVWHMLDVGACTERLIDGHGAFDALSPAQRRSCVILVALHDVGKISHTFRTPLRDRRPGAYRHWKLSDVLLTRTLDPIIAGALGGDAYARGELYAPVSGHHGGPERSDDRRELWRRTRALGADAEEAVKNWTSLLLELLPGATLEEIDQHLARKLSWALSGLTVAADWVASNTEWFPPTVPDIPPRDYLERARDQSAYAVTRAGLHPSPPATRKDAETFIGVTELRPMQAVAGTTTLLDGSTLALIEGATGASDELMNCGFQVAFSVSATARKRTRSVRLSNMATFPGAGAAGRMSSWVTCGAFARAFKPLWRFDARRGGSFTGGFRSAGDTGAVRMGAPPHSARCRGAPAVCPGGVPGVCPERQSGGLGHPARGARSYTRRVWIRAQSAFSFSRPCR